MRSYIKESTTGNDLNLEIRFTSNLCAVLNDPSKDRNKVNYLFTKKWGNDFVDNLSTIPTISQVNPKYATLLKRLDFKDYLSKLGDVCDDDL